VIDVDPAMDLDGFALETVQPSLIADCAQVLNKSGKYLVRVRLVEIDESGTFNPVTSPASTAASKASRASLIS
jgi:hypothetical protein